MCGIAGFFDPKSGVPSEVQHDLHRMVQSLKHRGPDDAGSWVDGAAGIALGFRRLSILDLSPSGHQPMLSSCGRYVLISNGEIYNFQALRRELESRGCALRGRCDTEVMLETISQRGLSSALDAFEGMYAFALWDRQERELYLCRDRIGEKPLYFGWSGGVFLFGSELKALTRHPRFEACVDRGVLALYLRYGYVPAPYSIYRGIRKVMPGSILTLAAGKGRNEPIARAYWSCRDAAERGLADPFRGSLEDAAEHLEELLQASVNLRMQADVPVGAFLSGGYDSSTLVSLMRRATGGRIKTFTLGFEENDELPFAREVARHLDTEHTDARITAADALQLIPQLPRIYDEPFSDSSQIPTFLISKLARNSVSVILTGDAGDELFCGYGRYDPAQYPGAGDAARVSAYLQDLDLWEDPARLLPGEIEPAFPVTQPECWLRTSELRNQFMYLDLIGYLPDDLLVKLDRAAMAVSLETRVPFLDRAIMHFAWQLPLAMKVNQGRRKWVLREVLYRYVPPALVDRPKQGFSIPLLKWLTGPLRDWAESLLEESRLRRDGFFDPEPIRKGWREIATGRHQLKHAMWTVLMFQAWLDGRAEGVNPT